jgi:hypothetical protein
MLAPEEKMNTVPSPAAPLPARLIHRIARIGRFVIFLCTAGWIYPHACTERMDLTQIQNRHAAAQD